MSKKTCIEIYKKDNDFYWTVCKELTGNDSRASCGPFDTISDAIKDMEIFLNDSDAWEMS